ncbi:hypothetical protein BTZ20_3546 [Rhodococcus sp. MTM3W5.2]|uniref:hypothetical protein n=1 Tax=Rhodococcus sp. MTM3W5.2 TaxID=1805827 RepID=UPI0009792001|nr:hypothetical protein [Rhodococcus sp. MTM3W5.2]AQA24566.1 hypothetical protein BTZ20_3546 [Rhodococcus sp. MTM3W5.2]
MRKSAAIIGATIAAVGLTIGTAGIANALPVSIPGTTSHPYVAGVDVEPGSYYSRMTDSTRFTCDFVMTPDGDNPPSHSTDFTYHIVDLKIGDRLDSVGCTTWHRQGSPLGSAGSTDFGSLGVLGLDDVIFGHLPLGS